MLILGVVVEKKPVGRPAAFDVGTRQVKLPEDLVQMIQWLIRLEGEGDTLAQIIDPLVRPTILERYSQRYHEIAAIKAAEDAAKKHPSPPLPPPLPDWSRMTADETIAHEMVMEDQTDLEDIIQESGAEAERANRENAASPGASKGPDQDPSPEEMKELQARLDAMQKRRQQKEDAKKPKPKK